MEQPTYKLLEDSFQSFAELKSWGILNEVTDQMTDFPRWFIIRNPPAC